MELFQFSVEITLYQNNLNNNMFFFYIFEGLQTQERPWK